MNEGLLWDVTDGDWAGRVRRTGAYSGEFIATKSGVEMDRGPVSLSYGARFGLDVADDFAFNERLDRLMRIHNAEGD